ncbi:MAG: hypothetical protein J6C92_04865 [Bacteroidaceae bacterium]|nr:hypothetical protein [Bacteroidaceae bacterium]
MKRISAILLLIAIMISTSSCSSLRRNQPENQVKISFVNEAADSVYGIQIEYLIDRVRIGGMEASNDPEMTEPFERNEKIYCGIPEKMVLEGAETIPFGLLVYVTVEDQRSVPLKFMWEWTAEYNSEYIFILGGSEKDGYTVSSSGSGFACTVTSWDKLPAELLE